MKNPTESIDYQSFTYYEGSKIPNTEIFVPMEKYDGIGARPVVSPDGRSIAYYKFYAPRDSFGLYVINVSMGEERFLVKDGTHPEWSPDGEWIAFNINKHIYKIRYFGGNLTQLTFPTNYFGYSGSEYDVDWSPDNMNIAFAYDIDYRSNVQSGIYMMKSDGKEVRFSEKQYLFQASDPDWQSDGAKILGTRGYSPSSIWTQFPVFDFNLNRVDKILDGAMGEYNRNPHISPDGYRIVFWNEKGIWVINSDGTNLKHILPNDLSPDRHPEYKAGIKLLVGSPSWYPDGKYLIYTHFKVTRYIIHQGPTIGPNVNVEGYMSFYKVNVDSAIAYSNLP